ncbi:MAG: site-2 protease family protein [Anaerolineales bacterium]|nr:site-2 protease family protein [Anaerolineales bacterium]
MSIIWSIIAIFLVLTPVVLVHEWGHFSAARLCRIRVEEFGIGLPPRAARLFTRKGTLFSLNWIPLGGFVRPAGENNPDIPGGLAAAPWWARLLVLGAGPVANFIFALALLWLAFYLGPTATRITEVIADSPAMVGGLLPGDILLEMGGVRVDSTRVMAEQISEAQGRPFSITVQRGEEIVTLVVTPLTAAAAQASGQWPLGVIVEQTSAHGYLRHTPLAAARQAFAYVRELFSVTFNAPGQLARGEITPAEARPVSIVGLGQLAGRATANSFITGSLFPLLLMAGLISAALGLTQLLPLPALDGGRILFVLIEVVRGKRVDAGLETAVHRAGIILILVLVVVLVIQDIVNPVVQ